MKKHSNLLYIMYSTFNTDLLFWIVVDNLFLSTVKGVSEFNIILITMLGLLFSILLFPFTNLIIKKLPNRVDNIIGAVLNCVAITLFCFCNTLCGFIIAQTLYNMSSPFKQSAAIILKNNLKGLGKQSEFVKVCSYGRLGYSIITAAVALVSGWVFNVHPYLPIILCGACTIIALILAIIYKDIYPQEEQMQASVKIIKTIKSKLMINVLFVNIFAVGSYVFLQTKSTLLIQFICEKSNFILAKISVLISIVIFISRLFRVAANLMFPTIYNKIKNKQKLLVVISILLLVSGVLYAIGANLLINPYINIIFIAIGLFIVISIRDLYATIENKIIINNFQNNEQKLALVLADIYGKIGRLVINAFALLIVGVIALNWVYIFMIIFCTAQIFVMIKLSKYIKED